MFWFPKIKLVPFTLFHTVVVSFISVLFIMPRLDAKELFCSRDTGKTGLTCGGNSAFILIIIMLSNGAPSAHRKINMSSKGIYPLMKVPVETVRLCSPSLTIHPPPLAVRRQPEMFRYPAPRRLYHDEAALEIIWTCLELKFT